MVLCRKRLILTIIALVLILSSCSSSINVTDCNGNVSIRYTNKSSFDTGADLLPYLSENELFEQADYIFSGVITDIKNIDIDFDGKHTYKSLLSIRIDELYKGDYVDLELTVLAPPISRSYRTEDQDLLQALEKGSIGLFMVSAVSDGTYLSDNGCSFDASEICDSKLSDGLRFGFLRNNDDSIECCDTLSNSDTKVFGSLKQYNWDSLIEYVSNMLSTK